MRKNVVLSVLAVLLCYSCMRNPQKVDYQFFITELSKLDENLIDHFPSRFDETNAIFSGHLSARDSDRPYYSLILTFFENKPDIITNLITSKKYIAKINPQDTCSLIIPWMSDISYDSTEFVEIYDSINFICDEFEYPIPNFMRECNLLGISDAKLPVDFEIFINETGNTLLFDINNPRYYGLPDYWLHGYSKGIASSMERGILIYWVIVW